MTHELEFPDELFNPKFIPYLYEVNSSIEILYGGAGGSKTVHSSLKDIMRILQGKNILIVRQVYGTLHDSYYTELKKAVSTLGVADCFRFKKTPLSIECANGKVILFRGLDDVEKIKGITVPNGVIDHITIEEIPETKEASVNQLQFRTRGGGSKLTQCEIDTMKDEISGAISLEDMVSSERKFDIFKKLGFDSREDFNDSGKTLTGLLNPVSVNSWVYKRFFCDSKGKVIHKVGDEPYHTPELYIMHSTHWDNHFLTYDDHVRYEQYKFINQYFYSVYAQGRWGVLGDLIFTNVKPARFNADFIRSIPEVYVGMDFGVTDPNAMVRTGINHEKREIYIIDESVESNLNSEQISTMARNFLYYPTEEINADCAGSQMIKDLRDNGFNVRPVVKYGKIKGQFKSHGIATMWGYTIFVNVECPIFMSEITEYTWKRNKDDVKTGEPNDGNDHCIDSGLFYALNKVLMKTKASRIY